MPLEYILVSASGLLLCIWLTLILLHHRIYEEFPIFFTYNVYAVVVVAARLVALYISGKYYFYLFWWTEFVSLLLAIAAMHEVFRSVFDGFYLLRWFRWCYFAGIMVVLISSALNSIFNPAREVYWLFGIILGFVIPINGILAAIFALFYIAAKLLKVSFRRHSFAIVLGFGISAIGTLIPYVVRSIFGKKMEGFVIHAPSVSYYLTLLVWLIAFYRQESGTSTGKDTGTAPPPLSSEEMAGEVKQYIRILKGLLGKSKDDDAAPPHVSSGQMADEVRQ